MRRKCVLRGTDRQGCVLVTAGAHHRAGGQSTTQTTFLSSEATAGVQKTGKGEGLPPARVVECALRVPHRKGC